MNIFIDKNYPKNGNNYSKETIKSIYNYIRPLNYFLFLDITLFKNNRLYIIHKFQMDIQKMVIKQFPIFLHHYVKNFCEIKV